MKLLPKSYSPTIITLNNKFIFKSLFLKQTGPFKFSLCALEINVYEICFSHFLYCITFLFFCSNKQKNHANKKAF